MNRDYVQEGLEAAQEEHVGKTYLGVIDAQVVGINHYQGHVNNRETVLLVREPTNPYDRYAIRVDNVQGVQVGHMPRVVVMHLSPLIDSGDLFVEGLVPKGTKNKFKMPLKVLASSKEGREEHVKSTLRSRGIEIGSDYAAERMFNRASQQGTSRDDSGVAMSTREVEDSLSKLFEELLQGQAQIPVMRAGDRVGTKLMMHQQEALAWMIERENSGQLPPFWEPHKPVSPSRQCSYLNTLTNFITEKRPEPFRGGILADDMGLGKTLTVLALIATNHPGATLPEVSMIQAAEDAGAAAAPSRKTAHGSRKRSSTASASTSSPAPKKGKLSAAAQALHDAAAAEQSPNEPPAAAGPKTTLVVCPVSVLSNWQAQLKEHCGEHLTMCLHHGEGRAYQHSQLESYDIVLTTYGIVNADSALLERVSWLRVVLDEGHFIKNPGARQSESCAALRARSRWVVTGTPIQNSMKDLYGLIKFLHLEPLDNRAVFNPSLERPIKLGAADGLMRLKVLMGAIAMRRMKTSTFNGRPLVELPSKTIQIVKVDLDRDAQETYNRWEAAGQAIVSSHIDADTLFRNYASVLEIILRLRQICDCAALCPVPPPDAPDAASTKPLGPSSTLPAAEVDKLLTKLTELMRADMLEECPICMDDVRKPVITRCGHIFCRTCMDAWLADRAKGCPLCREPVQLSTLVDAPELQSAPAGSTQAGGQPDGQPPPTSAKVDQLMQFLNEAAAESKTAQRPVKSVVFSQFTSMLDVVDATLQAAGISFIRIEGSVSAKKRTAALNAFAEVTMDSPRVALVSLKAGGVGLNLTSASRVHLLDPWWNPSTEDQAMDRVHRIGQTQPVSVYRYVAFGTIEERLLLLQNKKRELAKGAFERRRPEEVQAERLADVKLLMRL